MLSLARTAALGAAACAILGTLAYLNGRVTIYTLTDRRLLIRFGVALQITMNLPFGEVREAHLRVGEDGIGDIPLVLGDTRRVGYIVLWPHVRPWRLTRPQPMLRAVPDATEVAGLLAAALGETATDGAATTAPGAGRAGGANRPATPAPRGAAGVALGGAS